MAALFPKIYDVIEKNPSRTATLRWRSRTATEGSSHPSLEKWDTFFVSPLTPPGPLSLCLLYREPLFELASESLRTKILTESLLTLQDRAEKELVGRRFPRKKIQDALAGQISAEAPKSSALVEEVLCELFSFQKISLNRRTKTVSFFPSDPRVWSSSRQILVGEQDNCWTYRPTTTLSLSTWLTDKEEEGWSIAWPTADGKLDDLKAGLLTRGIVYDPKQKKEDLAHRLGRAQALQSLSSLSFTPAFVNLEVP
jgi:hypothetical protein